MSKSLQELLKESLLNNSYDYDSMHNTLVNTWTSSYSYLYAQQKASIEYEELHFYSGEKYSHDSKHIGHLYLDKLQQANFAIDYDLIHVMDREEYRTSKYYLNRFTLEDMADHPEIFDKIPIIIIDDKVIWDYTIRITKDDTRFKLPFRRQFVLSDKRNPKTDDYIYIDHKIQVLIVDNVFYHRVTFNKYTLNYTESDHSIHVSKATIRSALNTYIATRVNQALMEKYNVKSAADIPSSANALKSSMTNHLKAVYELPKQMGIMFGSLHFTLPPVKRPTGHRYPSQRFKEQGSQLIEFNDDPANSDYYVAYLSDDIASEVANSSDNILLSLIFMNRLIHYKTYDNKLTTTAFTANGKPGANLLVLQEDEYMPYSQPVPTENFIVFKRNAGEKGYVLKPHNDMVELHYPNIYRIIDSGMKEGDEYKIYYFYYRNDTITYTCLFDFYYYFLHDIFIDYKLEKLLNDIYYDKLALSMYNDEQKAAFKEVFNKLVLEYKFYNHQYEEIDFLHRYLPLKENYNKRPKQYKDETLREWIKVQPWVLRDYVLDQKKLGDSFHLFANTIDLSTRIRKSTKLEMGDDFGYDFQEERYVFAIANEKDYPLLLDCRVFVDGILVGDVYEERKNYVDYLYIPTTYVSKDSYIEIEIFPSYTFKQRVKFDSLDQTKTITLIEFDNRIFRVNKTGERYICEEGKWNKYSERGDPLESNVDESTIKNLLKEGSITEITTTNSRLKNIWPTQADIYYQYDNDDIHKVRYDSRLFDYTVHYSNADHYYGDQDIKFESDDPSKPVKFTRLKKFTIKPNDELVLNKPLWLCISKKQNCIRFMVSRPGFPFIEIDDHEFQFNKDYIRIYRNGRLIPRSHYRLLTTYVKPRIMFMEWMRSGDLIYIDITPYRYTELYYQEELEKGQTTIDLRGVITKPFDIRYYDVYVNGRKMSLNSVFAVTPWEITFVNLKSIYNIEIFEKERDWEYFGLDYKEHIYYFTLDDLLDKKKNLVSEDEKNKIIKDIIDRTKDPRLIINPNTNDEEKQRRENDELIYAVFHVFYFDELIPKTFVNPDRLQFSDLVMQDNYMEIYERYKHTSADDDVLGYGKERKKNYPGVIELDPDITVYSPTKKRGEPVEFLYTATKDPTKEDADVDMYEYKDLSPYLDTSNLDPNNKYYVVPVFDGFQIVYCVGHILDVEQEFLDQSKDLTIPEKGNIETYKKR